MYKKLIHTLNWIIIIPIIIVTDIFFYIFGIFSVDVRFAYLESQHLKKLDEFLEVLGVK